jgi:hypothetical protein
VQRRTENRDLGLQQPGEILRADDDRGRLLLDQVLIPNTSGDQRHGEVADRLLKGDLASVEQPPRVRAAVPAGDEPGVGQRPVVDQAMLCVLGDLQVVVDRVAQDDLRFWAVRGEDQILQLAAHPSGTGQPEQVVQDVVILENGRDLVAKGKQLGQLPVPDPLGDIAVLPAPGTLLVFSLRGQAKLDTLLRQLPGAHPFQRPGDRLAQRRCRQPVRQRRRRRGREQTRQQLSGRGMLVRALHHPAGEGLAACSHAQSLQEGADRTQQARRLMSWPRSDSCR